MTPADLIIFDCDGVLVDSELLSCRCVAETLGAYGIAITIDEIIERFLGRNVATMVNYYAAEGRALPPTFATDLAARVRESFRVSLRPIEGVATVLRQLDVPSCVASSSDVERVSMSLVLTDLASHFGPRLYTSQMVANGKPAPDLFLFAAAQMQVDPRRALVIEDSVSGVQAGKAAGMTVWGFTGGSHYRSRDVASLLSDAGADRVFARMADFG
jgi:HAD superfamily hydrolase (TIGR01509 family)